MIKVLTIKKDNLVVAVGVSLHMLAATHYYISLGLTLANVASHGLHFCNQMEGKKKRKRKIDQRAEI